MSELSMYSIRVAIGDIRRDFSRVFENQGISLKGAYSATPERELAAETAYMKNRIRLEAEHLPRTLEPGKPAFPHETKNVGLMRGIHVLAMDAAITQIEPLAAVAKKKHGEKLKKVSGLIQTIKTHFKEVVPNSEAVNILSTKCEPLLREMAKDAHSLLSGAEDRLALEALTGELDDLGYEMLVNGRDIIGSKGTVCLRARAEGGRLRLDSTAYPGLSCQKEIRRLETALRRRGLVLGRICEDASKTCNKNHQMKDLFPPFERDVLKSRIATIKVSAKRKAAKGHRVKPEVHRHLLLSRMRQLNMNRIKRRSI